MKIVVIGGTGLIGKKLISKLNDKGCETVAASPSKGINTLTGEGLTDALKGADVVVDVSNSPSFEDKAVLEFFETSTRNLLKTEKESGVKHHIALSIVGTELLPDSGYFRAKLAQENLIKTSHIPFTIVRATQFFEFMNSIVESNIVGQTIHAPAAFIQPIASEDVANELAKIVLSKPANGIIEIAGPERYSFSEIIDKYLKATNGSRKIITDADSRYFGAKLAETSLVPQKNARLGSIKFLDWLSSD